MLQVSLIAAFFYFACAGSFKKGMQLVESMCQHAGRLAQEKL